MASVRRTAGIRSLALIIGLGLALVGAAAAQVVAALPAHADTTIDVLPDSVSSVDVSPAGTPWDRNPGAAQSAYAATAFSPADLPSSGDAPWKLDIENKPLGQVEVTEGGFVLGVEAGPATKARVQYYIGSGGYPAIDAQAPTLASLFDQPISWTQTLLTGPGDYGVTLQIQLQKEISAGQWARVTVVSHWAPGTGARDLRSGLWFANTDIHADGFLTGAKVNNRQSGPGVSASTLLANFGDFDVVSFGPNLGRDGIDYVYSVQDFRILGQRFHTAVTPPASDDPPPAPPSVPPSDPTEDPALLANADEVPASAATVTPPPAPGEPRSLTLELGAGFENQWYYVVLYSDPTVVGWVWVGPGGTVTFPIPDSLPAGEHTVALVDDTGTIVAYATGVSIPALLALAETGVDLGQAWLIGGIGGSLVLSGLVLVAAARSRRRLARQR